jgi:hypothetical protein
MKFDRIRKDAFEHNVNIFMQFASSTFLACLTALLILHLFAFVELSNNSMSQALASSLINNTNTTTLDASILSNNSISTPIISLGNITIGKIPKPHISMDVSNVTEQPEPKPSNLSAFAFLKTLAETSNASTTASKEQFSIGPFVGSPVLNKTTSVNSSASNQVSDEGSAVFSSSSSILATNSLRSSNQLQNPENIVIEGLNINTAGSLRRNPPDPQIAVGPNHIVEMVNVGAGFWLKTGTHLKTVDLPLFFKTPDHTITDPRVLYDNSTGRWFASITDMNDNTVVLSVSQTNDPTAGNWTIFKLLFSGCPDQQKMGLSKDKVIISANVVEDNCPTFGQPKGGQFIVLNKTDLVKGEMPTLQNIFVSRLIPSLFSLHPAEFVNSAESDAIFMVTLGEQGFFGGKTVTVFALNGTLPNLEIKNTTLEIQPVEQPKSAEQPGRFSPPIDTGDARVQDAHWQNGNLWLVANDRCIPIGDSDSRDCIRLVEINTENYTIIQDFDISLIGTYLFYPAIGIDSDGNLAVLFGYSSKILNYFPGVMVGGQSAEGKPNRLDNVVNITSGLSPSNTDRYGDYNAITIDPTNGLSFWGVAQRIPSQLTDRDIIYWSTFMGNFTALGSYSTR